MHSAAYSLCCFVFAKDYVNPQNDGIEGVSETRIAFLTTGSWDDWDTGSDLHGVVCRLSTGVQITCMFTLHQKIHPS